MDHVLPCVIKAHNASLVGSGPGLKVQIAFLHDRLHHVDRQVPGVIDGLRRESYLLALARLRIEDKRCSLGECEYQDLVTGYRSHRRLGQYRKRQAAVEIQLDKAPLGDPGLGVEALEEVRAIDVTLDKGASEDVEVLVSEHRHAMVAAAEE